jgi:photosystem II stability/assembly factor-like uncharacterized protein
VIEGVDMSDCTICLGTTGAGAWTSHDSGKTWSLSNCDDPWFPFEYDVRAVCASPHSATEVWASIEGDEHEDVIARSRDGGDNYTRVRAPVNGRQVWSIAVSPHDPNVVFAGTRPGGMLRTTDGGRTWVDLDIPVAQTCSVGLTRLLSIVFTDTPGEVSAGVEIDGIWHSSDNGDSWTRLAITGGEVLLGPGEVWKDERHVDIHGVAWGRLPDGTPALIAATPIGVFRTTDLGATWHGTRYPLDAGYEASVFYTRTVLAPPGDPCVLLVGVGRRPPDHGSLGGIERSTDGGATWTPVVAPLRSVVWSMASNPALPGTVVAGALNGQVLVSSDSGTSWAHLEREFGEVRAVAVLPGSA